MSISLGEISTTIRTISEVAYYFRFDETSKDLKWISFELRTQGEIFENQAYNRLFDRRLKSNREAEIDLLNVCIAALDAYFCNRKASENWYIG